jgi:delta1-piperideine-2-carboxylate reductase
MIPNMSFSELSSLIERILVNHGLAQDNAGVIAEVVAAAERDGSFSHGLTRLKGYVSTLESGWVDGAALPIVTDAAPGLVVTDANNGFAQIALAKSRPLLIEKARKQGVAVLAIRNSHHYAALWPDVEPFADEQLIALTTINTRSYMIVWGGNKKILGTNPMAFACPRREHPPVIWDQASSPMSHGDLLLASKEKRQIAPGVAVDADGKLTIDPDDVLSGGAFLAFGGHKGSAIAFMVEILSAAVTGGRFGYDDRVAAFPGGKTSHAGQFVMVLDPTQTAGTGFFDRVEEFLARLKASGVKRLPGQRRYERRKRAEAEGIPISSEHHEIMQQLLR